MELVEAEDAALVDQGEEDMMLKEAEGEEKVKIGPRWSDSQNWKKGAGKGSERDSFFFAREPRKRERKGTCWTRVP